MADAERARSRPVPDPTNRPSPLTALAAGLEPIARGADLDTGLGALISAAVAAVGARSGAVSLQDPDRPEPELTLTVGLDEAGQAEAVAAAAAADHPLTAAARDRTEVVAGGTVALPLIANRDGIEEPLGAIGVTWAPDSAPAEEDVAFLRLVADVAALAVDRGRLAASFAERSEWFDRLAHTDPLTGLANQRTFARVLELELARAGRQGGEVSVVILDVDEFGEVNRLAGREAGDDVLRSVAAIVAESVRLVDTVARQGGDEFVIVAPGTAGVTVAQRIVEGVAALDPIGGRAVTVSAGVARFPADGTDADALLAAARTAMDGARTGGGGRIGMANGAG
jgi:diguanylate cyclase (GGDEF)-like protein